MKTTTRLALLLAAALAAHTYGGDAKVTLDSTDGTSAFIVRDSASNELARVQSDGKVGIGTTTPGYRLDVLGDINLTGSLRTNGVAWNPLASFTELDPVFGVSVAAAIVNDDILNWNAKIGGSGTANYVPAFTASGTLGNSAIFSTNGNVGIGTTTPLRSLHNGSRAMIITDAQTGVADWQKWSFFSVSDPDYLNKETLCLGMINDAGTQVVRGSTVFTPNGCVGFGIWPNYALHANGSVAGSGAYVNTSDARLKKDVQPINDALAIVEALRGVTFNWDQSVDPSMKLDDRNHVGFLAQEVEAVLPQAVSTASDARQTKSLAYSEVIPVLVEAIKQQQTQIDALKAEVEALKAK
jgi:hypothetical protein